MAAYQIIGGNAPGARFAEWLGGGRSCVRVQDFIITLIVVVVGIYLLRPYLERQFLAETTPRPVEARGNLAEFEKLTIRNI